MAVIDSWTDFTVERALHLLRIAETIVLHYRRPVEYPGVRPVTIDRFLVDVAEFNQKHMMEMANAEAAVD